MTTTGTTTTYSPPTTPLAFLQEANSRLLFYQTALGGLVPGQDPIVSYSVQAGLGLSLLGSSNSGAIGDLTSVIGPNPTPLGTPQMPDPTTLPDWIAQAQRRIAAAIADEQVTVPGEATASDADIDAVHASLQQGEQAAVLSSAQRLALWGLRDLEQAVALLNNLVTSTGPNGMPLSPSSTAGTGAPPPPAP